MRQPAELVFDILAVRRGVEEWTAEKREAERREAEGDALPPREYESEEAEAKAHEILSQEEYNEEAMAGTPTLPAKPCKAPGS